MSKESLFLDRLILYFFIQI